MLRTVVYIRKSSNDKDEKQVQSHERQEMLIKDFVEVQNNLNQDPAKKFNIDWSKNVYRESQSAKKPGRKIFGEMMEEVMKGKYDVILCVEPSRLSRNPIDTGRLVYAMDTEKIQQIQTTSSVFYSENPTDRFTLNLFLSIAKYENDQRGKNTSTGMQNSKMHGGTTNLAPTGYINTGTIKGSKKVERDGNNFEILQEAWKMLVESPRTITEIYKICINRGLQRVKSFKGGAINRCTPSLNTFRYIFSNKYYLGYVASKKGYAKGDRGHEAMVTEEEFEKAQMVLQKRGFKHSDLTSKTYENILENLLICGKTGNKLYASVKKRYYCPCGNRFYSNSGPKECSECGIKYVEKKYKNIETRKYFEIRGGIKHKITQNSIEKDVSSFNTDFIENLVQKELNNIYISEGLFILMKKRLYSLWIEKQDENEKIIQQKNKEIQKIKQKQKEVLTENFSKNTLKDIAKDVIEDYYKKIEDIKSEISDLQDEIDESFEIVWQALNSLLQAKDVFKKGQDESFEPKRNLLLSMFSNLKFIDGKIIPEWKEPFNLLANRGIKQKKGSYALSARNPSISKWLPG